MKSLTAFHVELFEGIYLHMSKAASTDPFTENNLNLHLSERERTPEHGISCKQGLYLAAAWKPCYDRVHKGDKQCQPCSIMSALSPDTREKRKEVRSTARTSYVAWVINA